MQQTLSTSLAAALLVLSGATAAQTALPDPGHDPARQARMDAAYQDHLRQQSASSKESTRPGAAERFEDTARRDAHKSGHAIKTAAHKTGEAIKTAAHKTGTAIRHGVHRIEGKPDAASSPST